MAGHFLTLLHAIVDNPAQSIAHLPLLSEAERHQLLFEWNDTATHYPQTDVSTNSLRSRSPARPTRWPWSLKTSS